MATYTVGASDNGIGSWTLAANQVDTVAFTANITRVRVISDGAADAYVTFDGTDPTVPAAGAATRAVRVPAGGQAVLEVDMDNPVDAVKLISAGTPKVSVERAF